MIRKADTPEARKMWEEVEKAASYCPEWMKPYIDKYVKECAKQIRNNQNGTKCIGG